MRNTRTQCEKCGWKLYTINPIECPRCKTNVQKDTPLTFANWPRWAKWVRRGRFAGDVGVGDTIKRYADLLGGEEFKRWAAFFGIPCGCADRQELYNSSYPYQTIDGALLVEHVISFDEWTRDTLTLSQLILANHPDVSGVAGCPRSGMRAACDVALRLGVPLYEATPAGLRYVGGGSRIRTPEIHGERKSFLGPIVIVDDSTCSGHAVNELRQVPELAELPVYVVYAASPGKSGLTGYVTHLELPHWFDWNLFNNGQILSQQNVGIDFDGVLCRDCLPADDDDGPRYVAWLASVLPIRMPRDFRVPFIVTARREAYRELTEEWLHRHRINYGELVMFQGTFEQRSITDLGQWKAEQCERVGVGLFIESDYTQAKRIADIRQRPVISIERPAGGRVLPEAF